MGPSIQKFERELIWLYQQHKYRILKTNLLKLIQYTLPMPIFNHLIATFNLTHSYFSSPTTCPQTLRNFFFLFTHNKIFESMDLDFLTKWFGYGLAHLTTSILLQQAIHWEGLATTSNLQNTTISMYLKSNWHQNNDFLKPLFLDTHIIAHYPSNSISFYKPMAPPKIKIIHIEENALLILCIHHHNTSIEITQSLQQLINIPYQFNIPILQIQSTKITPNNITIN